MKLKRFAMLSCLTAGLLLSSVPTTPVNASTVMQITTQGSGVSVHGVYSKNGVPLSGTPALLTVSDANDTLSFVSQTDTTNNGMFEFDWTMPPGAASGTYTVKVSIEGDVQTATFAYTADSTDAGGGFGSSTDDGPIRFTGELNGGNSQAVIYNSDTGLQQHENENVNGNTVTINLTNALSVVQNAPSGTTDLTISVPSNTEFDTTIFVPGPLIAQEMQTFGQAAHLLVATHDGSYDLPLQALNSQLLNGLESDPNGFLCFHINRTNPDAAHLVQIDAMPAHDLLGEAGVNFDLSANYGGQLIPIRDFGNQFVKYSINLPGTQIQPSWQQSAVMINPKTSTLVPTPSTLYHDAVGHTKIVITRTGNGTYFPIEATRSFADIPASMEKTEIEVLASKAVVSGTSATTFDPNSPITRAQFATLMVRALGLSDKQGSTLFGDVTSSDWFGDYVGIGSSLGLISGYSSYQFAPNDPISREQLAALLARGLQFVQNKPYVDTARVLSQLSDQNLVSSWARDDVALALQTGIIDSGTTTLQPLRYATRAESAAMLYNLLQYLKLI